jgi:hypothetical protein
MMPDFSQIHDFAPLNSRKEALEFVALDKGLQIERMDAAMCGLFFVSFQSYSNFFYLCARFLEDASQGVLRPPVRFFPVKFLPILLSSMHVSVRRDRAKNGLSVSLREVQEPGLCGHIICRDPQPDFEECLLKHSTYINSFLPFVAWWRSNILPAED